MTTPLTTLPRVRFPKARCSVCKRIRHLTSSGVFVQHGPGPDSYVCSGSGRAS